MPICTILQPKEVTKVSKFLIKDNSIENLFLGSHKLPIETGRWKGLDRCDRLCPECQVLGDEEHYLFHCSLVRRDDLLLPEEFGNLWKNANVFKLFARLVDVDLLQLLSLLFVESIYSFCVSSTYLVHFNVFLLGPSVQFMCIIYYYYYYLQYYPYSF